MRHRTASESQKGIVAIFVVMIIMTMLGLITIGFSRLMNREVRQALDRQLSAQAFYSSESGINDTVTYLNSTVNPAGTGSTCDAHSANAAAAQAFMTNGNISEDKAARYSCLFIDTAPKQLKFSLGAGESRVFKLSMTNLRKLFVSWQNPNDGGNPNPMTACAGPNAGCKLPTETALAANSEAVIKAVIYPVNVHGSACPAIVSNDLINHTGRYNNTDQKDSELTCDSRNYFMYPDPGAPNSGAGAKAYNTSNGGFISGLCNNNPATLTNYTQATEYFCNSSITNIKDADSYFVRLTAEYTPANIAIQTVDSSNNAVNIGGVQGVVDVTGVGQDELRRVQATISLQQGPNAFCPAEGFCPSGLQSMMAICKTFRVPITAPSTYGSAYDDFADTVKNDKACQTPNGNASIVSSPLPGITLAPPPEVHIYANGVAGSINIYPSDNVTISWHTVNAIAPCTASGNGTWAGDVNALPDSSANAGNGPRAVGSDYIWTLTCYNADYISASDTVTVHVIPVPVVHTCNDGIDNDGDGYADWTGDPDCDGDPSHEEDDFNGGTCSITGISHAAGNIQGGGGCTRGGDQWSAHVIVKDSSGTVCSDDNLGPQSSNLFAGAYSTGYRYVDVWLTLVGSYAGATALSDSWPNPAPSGFTC